MAVVSKVNSDLQQVSVLDTIFNTAQYTNPIVATFNGVVTGATTITVSQLQGTITIGHAVRGAGIPEGTVVAGYAAPTLTVTVPAGSAMTVSTQQIYMVTANPLYTVNATVQSGGAKVDYYTLTIQSGKHQAVLDAIQSAATVCSYEVKSATSIAVGWQPAGVWGQDAVGFGVAAPTVLAALQAAPGSSATLISAATKGASLTG